MYLSRNKSYYSAYFLIKRDEGKWRRKAKIVKGIMGIDRSFLGSVSWGRKVSSTQNEILKPNIPLLGDYDFLPPLLNIGSVSRTKQASSTRWKPHLRLTYPQGRVCVRALSSSLHPEMFNFLCKTDPHGKGSVGAALVPALGLRSSPRSEAQRSASPRERRELGSPFPGPVFGLVS